MGNNNFANMKTKETVFWFIWFIMVVIWNYGYPAASPFLDVLVAVILSIANILAIKFLNKK